MSRFDAAAVRRYYDRHTSAFVAFGQGRGTGAIHRAVWGPRVASREAAFHYVDEEIAALARSLLAEEAESAETDLTVSAISAPSRELHIVDLGCGVGASLLYLADRLPMRGTGVTLSPVQVDLATRQIAATGLTSRLACVEGDYCNLPAGIGSADLAYAIESFVHAPAPTEFFEQCRRLIRPGGLLVICDDVRGAGTDVVARRTVDEFCRGWHINTLLRPEELREMAQAAGFAHERTHDLTPYLELRRWRDVAIGVMLSAMSLLRMDRSRVDDLVGGHALQTCLQRGWVRYEMAVFRRRSS